MLEDLDREASALWVITSTLKKLSSDESRRSVLERLNKHVLGESRAHQTRDLFPAPFLAPTNAIAGNYIETPGAVTVPPRSERISRKTPRGKALDTTEDFIRRKGPTTKRDICAWTGLTDSGADQRIQALFKQKRIKRIAHGVYVTPEYDGAIPSTPADTTTGAAPALT